MGSTAARLPFWPAVSPVPGGGGDNTDVDAIRLVGRAASNRATGEGGSAAVTAEASGNPAGDRTIDGLVDEHRPWMVRFAVSLVGWNDADDLVSTVLSTLWRNQSWAAADDPRAFACTALVRAAASHHRTTYRREAREARSDPEAKWVGIEPDPDPELGRALAGLPVRQRAVIHLTYWDDLPPRVVAKVLGISDGAVRRHLARARSTLRRELT